MLDIPDMDFADPEAVANDEAAMGQVRLHVLKHLQYVAPVSTLATSMLDSSLLQFPMSYSSQAGVTGPSLARNVACEQC